MNGASSLYQVNSRNYSILNIERIRRREEMKKIRAQKTQNKIILSLVLFIFIFLFMLNFNKLFTKAESANEALVYKYYTSYEVKSGDTLWNLSKNVVVEDNNSSIKDMVEEIMYINNLDSDSIQSGEVLIIPYYSTELK